MSWVRRTCLVRDKRLGVPCKDRNTTGEPEGGDPGHMVQARSYKGLCRLALT